MNFITVLVVATAVSPFIVAQQRPATAIPRTPDGKPKLDGIWQAVSTANSGLEDHNASLNLLAGRSVVEGGQIPYQPWALAKRDENFRNRAKADPANQCFIPSVPRIMYMDFPFQIFQTPEAIGMAFEWSLDYRLIYTNGSKHIEDYESWMGDSRGHWEGDTLVVDVADLNDQTWLDAAGNFHSEALHVIERYRMTSPDTIEYEATLEDPKVFTKPWTIRVPLHRRMDRNQLYEYVCQAEYEEANGLFEREERTWYPENGKDIVEAKAVVPAAPLKPAPANYPRKPDGKPDLQGFYIPDHGGANYGLEKHPGDPLTPGGRGVIVEPADGILPMHPWAIEERASRQLAERGYDDPTAHCFPAGTPRGLYVPTSFYILQTSDHVVIMHERVAWRIIRLNATSHPPSNMRFWQGDSIGHWEGDTLVVDTANSNGKTWLNETGEVLSYAAHVVERFTPVGPDQVQYEAAINDPVVYTRPYTITLPINRRKFDLTEAACHEEDRDLSHLKAVKDAAAAKKVKQ